MEDKSSDKMNTLLLLGLTLIGWTLSESSLNWGKSTLKQNEVASSYLNTLEVCPQEVPSCPGKAEPRCFQDPPTWHRGPPSQGNTQWRCILCEETRSQKSSCFMIIPIETYGVRRRRKSKQTPTKTMTTNPASQGAGVNRNITTVPSPKPNQNPQQQQQQSLKQQLDSRAWPIQTPFQQQNQQIGVSPQNNLNPPNVNSPGVPQVQRTYQPTNINQPYQQPFIQNYGYQQRPYMPYDPSMVNTYNPQVYVSQTNPYVQPQYSSPTGYSDPHLSVYPY